MEVNDRRCVSCRRVAHRDEFFRVVRLQGSHEVCLDEGMGRSAYVCKNEECLKLAQKKKRMSRALKASVPDEFFSILHNRVGGVENEVKGDRS